MVLLAQQRPRRPQGPPLLLSLPHKREIACRRLAVPLSSLHGLQQRLYMGAMEVCACVYVGVDVLGELCSWRGAGFLSGTASQSEATTQRFLAMPHSEQSWASTIVVVHDYEVGRDNPVSAKYHKVGYTVCLSLCRFTQLKLCEHTFLM